MPLIEDIVKNIVVREIPGFKKANVDDKSVVFEGSDFLSLFKTSSNNDLFDKIDFYSTTSNDIYSIYKYFGVEAAREAIVCEIGSVFDVYGIKIDIRHLYLIADFMTRVGTFKPFNRNSFTMDDSFIQKMSFESCFTYLKNSAIFHQSERIENPSACLLAGKNLVSGTGSFELLYDMNAIY
jgi:DNA-directed RNA polymerase I subunit RPA1